MDIYSWLIVIAILILIGYLLDREIYFYEGAHLGPRLQAWLYDRWSRKYDEGKRESQLRDDEMLAQPLLNALKDVPEPFVLDFATGTGRLSFALMKRPEFKGRIVAVDISQGMLEKAHEKLGAIGREEIVRGDPAPTRRVEFLRHQSLPLPFLDATFDVVCCLEVLELLPDMDAALAEMSRLLRPGGILLTSRGTEASGRKAKIKSRLEFGLLLAKNDFETFEITPWWKLFDRVIAAKNGSSSEPVGARKLSEVMRCGTCGQTQWGSDPGVLKCRNCGNQLSVTREGIVLG
jgi:ubiquinone/menaquinone biosynthesis C-methylase UbiE